MTRRAGHRRQISRYIATATAFLIAAVSGVCLTAWFAGGLHPGLYIAADGIGKIEALRLPIGARRYADVKSFIIGMASADDYGRVYLNNYVVLNREASDLFGDDTSQNKAAATARIVDRKANKLNDREAREYLLEGKNTIIIELENAVGPCELRVDIRVNGVQLERFPIQLPNNFLVEQEAINPGTFRKLREMRANYMDDVICARRAFQFTLE